MSKKNYYEYLGISQKATNKEIKKACNEKIKILNNSKLKKNEKENIFSVIKKIHDTLTDSYKRGRYDQKIEDIKKKNSLMNFSIFHDIFSFSSDFDNIFNNIPNNNNSSNFSSFSSYSSIDKKGVKHVKKKAHKIVNGKKVDEFYEEYYDKDGKKTIIDGKGSPDIFYSSNKQLKNK
jgi:DnaJ-class molecular chaperone